MIHAYTGDGKGKSTAALGLLVRAWGAGLRVGAVLFDKGSKTYKHNEARAMQKLGIPYHITGEERMNIDGTFRFGITNADYVEAERGVKVAATMLQSGDFDLIVLDELLTAVTFKLIKPEELWELLDEAPKNCEVVLTGRCEDEALLARADLVSQVCKIRHYYDKGVQARPGIEY